MSGHSRGQLILQGSKDKLADIRLMQDVVESFRNCATLKMITEAGHSFHVLVRSGRTDEQVLEEVLETMVVWMLRK